MEQEERDFYTNAVHVTTTVYDVTLHFGVRTLVPGEPDKDPVLQQRPVCSIRMSPQHAKSIAALLMKHVVDYEAQAGLTLPIPPDIQSVWDKYCG